MPRPPVRRALVAVAMLVAVLGSSRDTAASPQQAPPPGDEQRAVWFEAAERKPAPGFTLPKVEGKEKVALASLRGKPVALVFGSYS